jgi:hypothetical protein
MSLKSNWSDWWRDFLGLARDDRYQALQILQQQYVEASQRASRLNQHALNMPYPHFRGKLLGIAADETKNCDQLAQQIKRLGGTLPAVPETPAVGRNSWRSLLADLEEQRRSAAEVWQQLHRIRLELPEVAELLQRIYETGKKHRAEITDMLMRSDPQAFLTG